MFLSATSGGLPKSSWKMINTAFDIVIITFRLKEQFPNRGELMSLGFSDAALNAGFHKMLLRRTLGRLFTKPWSPLPMMRW